MKTRTAFKLTAFAGLIIYLFAFIATSKPYPSDPCYTKLSEWWQKKDSSITFHTFLTLQPTDSVVIFSDSTLLIDWNNISDSVCKITKESCLKSGAVVLIVNRQDTVISHRDTKYGKKIFSKKCL